MAKNKNAAPESPQEVVLTLKPGEAQEASANDSAGVDLVHYRVACPNGIYLRCGPGRAFCPMAVLPDGAEVIGTGLEASMLRPDRAPTDSAWTEVLADGVPGWVDGVFLERIHG